MGKRSDFERLDRDLYVTPAEPVHLLTPFLVDVSPRFAEPFVGDGAIVRTLNALGYECGFAGDIEPQGEARSYAQTIDALDLTEADLADVDLIVTNPPWPKPRGKGEPTLSLIRHLIQIKSTWMLLSADFMHNVYAASLLRCHCSTIVAVGRVRWIAGSNNGGKDNACWYFFHKNYEWPTSFWPLRRPIPREFARDSVEFMLSR